MKKPSYCPKCHGPNIIMESVLVSHEPYRREHGFACASCRFAWGAPFIVGGSYRGARFHAFGMSLRWEPSWTDAEGRSE